MPRVTIVCPVALIAEANQLAAVLGQSLDDAQTFRGSSWQDAAGNLYAVASGEMSETQLAKMRASLTRPAWDTGKNVNMAAAARAQTAVVLLEKPTLVLADALTVLVWPNASEALEFMGLTQVPIDDF